MVAGGFVSCAVRCRAHVIEGVTGSGGTVLAFGGDDEGRREREWQCGRCWRVRAPKEASLCRESRLRRDQSAARRKPHTARTIRRLAERRRELDVVSRCARRLVRDL